MSRIVGMHRDCSVAQHGFRACGRHDHRLARVLCERITNVEQFSLDVFMLDFDIGESGQAAGAPIDQALAAIDQAVLKQADEDLDDGPRQAFIHRETQPLPVA